MGRFVVTHIVVEEGCEARIRKNLEPGEYRFTDNGHPDFYGKGFSVQVIVGENGSGKSSLLELMFRMVNNLAAVLFRDVECNAAENLYYVKGIRAQLHYLTDNVESVLTIDDEHLTLTEGNRMLLDYTLNRHRQLVNEVVMSQKETWEIASHFFYTIVTNYSMQAYISEDYQDEHVMAYNREGRFWQNLVGATWIDSFFHKNDGYMCPITLNPYRHEGSIDMSKEAGLTTDRVSALLIEYQRMNKQLIEGYDLHHIEYRLNKDKLIKGMKSDYANESREHKFRRVREAFRTTAQYGDETSVISVMLQAFALRQDADNDYPMMWTAKLYLVRKVLTIAAKYPSYQRFCRYGGLDKLFKTGLTDEEAAKYRALVRAVKNDKSHIVTKVRQTLNLIKNMHHMVDPTVLTRVFRYDIYLRELQMHEIERSVTERTDILPPPFFKPKIMLAKVIDKEGHTKAVPFSKLSSGERQFVYTTSSVVYHLLNLRSVRKGRPKYRLFNIVMDEVEICFHPEYQRVFLKRLLRIISDLGFMDRASINILMTTHSPFILSDMVQNNILYLKNGKPCLDNIAENPFAANVNDILRQNFFLKNGFMGAISQHRINRLIKFLKDDRRRNEYNLEHARALIGLVGDPLLKRYLERLYADFLRMHPEVLDENERERLITEYERRLAQLRRQGHEEIADN